MTLNGWDEGRDLALLVAEDAPNLPAVKIADPSSIATGDRIFAVSGLGASGASIVQGTVADAAQNGIQHDAPIGVQFQGGPMLDSSGELVAIALPYLRSARLRARHRVLRDPRARGVRRSRAVPFVAHRLTRFEVS